MQPLQRAVEASLASRLYSNAEFLAQRLHADQASSASLCLLAEVYWAQQRYAVVATLLEHEVDVYPPCRLLYAQACVELKDLSQAERALRLSEPSLSAHELYLLGVVCLRQGRRGTAVQLLTQACQKDAFLWAAYDELCRMGQAMDPQLVFAVPDQDDADPTMQQQAPQQQQQQQQQSAAPIGGASSHASTAASAAASAAGAVPGSSKFLVTPPDTRGGLFATPRTPAPRRGTGLAAFATPGTALPDPPVARSRIPGSAAAAAAAATPAGQQTQQTPASNITDPFTTPSPAQPVPSSGASSIATVTPAAAGVPPRRRKPARDSGKGSLFASEGRLRRSTRLQTLAERMEAHESTGEEDDDADLDADPGPASLPPQLTLAQLLRVHAQIWRALHTYQFAIVTDALAALPPSHSDAPWAHFVRARVYFHQAKYDECVGVFAELRRRWHWWSDGIDEYSVALWHQKDATALAYLAQQMAGFDRLCPETWCVVGNCFSLAKEHQNAVRFFRRAIQLRPHYAYAFTMCGHEYIALDSMDNAIACFRKAIASDERHYFAWYGLGTVYSRQERYELAEYHYRAALDIYPTNHVLFCYVGIAFYSNREYDDAMPFLERAIALNPRNTIARFARARALMAMEQPAAALEELETLRDLLPKESSLYHWMGKAYKAMGQTQKAMTMYLTALDSAPKDPSAIKASIDRINTVDPSLELDDL